MRDSEVVAAIVSGDPAGLAEAYGRYAAPLYAYCRTQLGEPEDASGAVLDTFVIAASKLRELGDPERLRAWLYTVARNACHRRLSAGARPASLDEAVGEAADEPGAVAGDAVQRALVMAAVAALSPDDRDVVELSLRQKLSGPDLADVLGVSRGRANALAARARRELRQSLRTLLAARLGRADCQELDALLADWDGQLTDLLCKRVRRHTEHCAVCAERERTDQAPEMLLSLLPVVGLPAGLRRQVLGLAGDPEQTQDLTPLIGYRADPFDTSGFPAALDRPRTIRLTGRSARAAATGSAAVAVVAVIAVVAFKTQHAAIAPAAAATGPGSVAAASATASPGTRQGVNLGPGRSGVKPVITPGIGAVPGIGTTPTPGASPAPRKTTPAPTKTSPAPVKTSSSPKPTPKPTTAPPTTAPPTTAPPTTAPPTTAPPTTPPPTTAPATTTATITPAPTPTPTVTTGTTPATASPTASPSAVLDLLLALPGLG